MNPIIGADQVLLNLSFNEQQFQNTVTQLSSGLRINSAADDPSGNAIATNLTSRVGGLQQAAQNVQNGVNALNVANGALSSVQNILIRVNDLIVESNSDINSEQDLQDIQAEIDSLMTEINAIGEKTNFNGLNLLNGQFDVSQGTLPSVTTVASPNGGSSTVSDYDDNGNPGPLVTNVSVPTTSGFFIPAFIVFTITGYSDNISDPDSGLTNLGPGVYLQIQAYSTEADFGSTPLFTNVIALPYATAYGGTGTSTGVQLPAVVAGPGSAPSDLLNFTLQNVTEADVGASMAFLTTAGTDASDGQLLTINDGGEEGSTVSMSLPTVNTNALGLSGVTVLSPQTIGIVPGSNFDPDYTGTSASNNITASYSQILVQNALTTITTQEAQIGAQIVAMGDDESDDNTTALNLQSSASDITDLNVGQATTDYTREQILTQVGTEVLSQIQSNGRLLTGLLINALIA
ncbi:MAG TPA: flagellin [Candidatus Acidoferrales bacterium]|nr:flagellin [Candidatus Acidoferrales bacterium]